MPRPTLVVTLLALFCVLPRPGLAQISDDHLYLIDYNTNTLWHHDPSNGQTQPFTTLLSAPACVVPSPAGTLYATTVFPKAIVEVDAAGGITPLYDANDGLGQIVGPNALVFAPNGDLYVASRNSNHEILVFPAGGGSPFVFADKNDGISDGYSMAFDRDGNLYLTDVSAAKLFRFDAAGNGTAFDSGTSYTSVVCRGRNDLYASDYYGFVYRWIGGDPNRRELFADLAPTYAGKAKFGAARAALQFDRLRSRLYYTHDEVDGVVEIDADTGASQLLAPGAFGTGAYLQSIAVPGEDCGTNFRPYLSGISGTGGFVPSLSASGDASLGGTVTVELRAFVGGAFGYLGVSFDPAADRLFGGDLGIVLDANTWLIPVRLSGAKGTAGAGTHDLVSTLPNDPALECRHFYLQAFAVDAGAIWHVSTSNALDLLTGH